DVAKRLRVKFEEKYSEFSKEAAKQNIKWTTVVRLASIIQREAAGKEDMPLISGILWNRLDKGVKLEVDASIQYIRGDVGKGFWAPISVSDKKIDSPYNTYMYKGLPPHPICNPGAEAIKAVLYPEKTACIFYLHDPLGKIHCAKDYSEHLKNIKEFLK
ncbi:MAG TPA: endolytic transglycosylase MltG, partial [Candidatus Paceibacterota bacterium]|nr:endolytic transglycosylase MltG [Candidatus Paceibacterota bacterium]